MQLLIINNHAIITKTIYNFTAKINILVMFKRNI